jgi:nucleotide-binding universal stress UspA family protein
LALDHLAADPKLARRLSPDLAWRFHALPIAEDEGRVTIAMANPDDAVARDAMRSALGPALYIVKADPVAIDALLTDVWVQAETQPPDVHLCSYPQPISDSACSYAQALGNLLGTRASRFNTSAEMDVWFEKGGSTGGNLIIFDRVDHPGLRRWLSGPAARTPARQSGTHGSAALVALRPRWPLRNMLLVLWGEESGDAALDWVVRLAQPSGSTVTILTVVPPVPAMYGRRAGMDTNLPTLLASATLLGQQLRCAAQRLVDCEIEGILRLRQGLPDRQICREMIQGDADLVAIPTRPRQWWRRWLRGDVVDPLLSRVDRPLLIAEPTIA